MIILKVLSAGFLSKMDRSHRDYAASCAIGMNVIRAEWDTIYARIIFFGLFMVLWGQFRDHRAIGSILCRF